MTFFSRLFPSRKLTALRVAREIADRDLRLAVLSRDTQRINAAQAVMKAATHAVMAHELAVGRG